MPCRFASSGTVATSRSASRAILALNVASNFLRDLVISVLHRLRQSRTLHTLTFGPISGGHFNRLPPTLPLFVVPVQQLFHLIGPEIERQVIIAGLWRLFLPNGHRDNVIV